MTMMNPIGYRNDGRRGYGPVVPVAVKSMASILAIACAIGSFLVHNAGGKFMLAVVAVVLGLIGMLRAVSPRISGGILSLVAIVLAAFGMLVAIVDAVF
ncbi:MAG: hypothetical protein JWO31_2144 [Phycisphaerales bacterium]|nr:hypothetical protein [Phycisphaerales bacterium]